MRLLKAVFIPIALCIAIAIATILLFVLPTMFFQRIGLSEYWWSGSLLVICLIIMGYNIYKAE